QPSVQLANCRSLVVREDHLPAHHAVVGFAGFFLDGLTDSLNVLERLVILFPSHEWEGHVGTWDAAHSACLGSAVEVVGALVVLDERGPKNGFAICEALQGILWTQSLLFN